MANVKAREVACPECGATVGDPCVGVRDYGPRQREANHTARVEAWQASQREAVKPAYYQPGPDPPAPIPDAEKARGRAIVDSIRAAHGWRRPEPSTSDDTKPLR